MRLAKKRRRRPGAHQRARCDKASRRPFRDRFRFWHADNELHAQRARRRLQVCDDGFGYSELVGLTRTPIDVGHRAPTRGAIASRFGASSTLKIGDAGDVAARPVEAGDKPTATGSPPVAKTIGIVWSPAFAASGRRGRRRNDHGDAAADEIGCQRRQPIELIVRPAVFDRHVLALDVARFLKPWRNERGSRSCSRIAFDRPPRTRSPASVALLRPRHHRPRRRAPEPRDELPPSHRSSPSRWTGSLSRPGLHVWP